VKRALGDQYQIPSKQLIIRLKANNDEDYYYYKHPPRLTQPGYPSEVGKMSASESCGANWALASRGLALSLSWCLERRSMGLVHVAWERTSVSTTLYRLNIPLLLINMKM